MIFVTLMFYWYLYIQLLKMKLGRIKFNLSKLHKRELLLRDYITLQLHFNCNGKYYLKDNRYLVREHFLFHSKINLYTGLNSLCSFPKDSKDRALYWNLNSLNIRDEYRFRAVQWARRYGELLNDESYSCANMLGIFYASKIGSLSKQVGQFYSYSDLWHQNIKKISVHIHISLPFC